jgi:hypothetical protein
MTTTATPATSAAALAVKALSDAKTAVTALLTVLESDIEASIPAVTTETEALVLEFIPQSVRAFVAPLLAAAESSMNKNIDAELVTLLKTGLGIALVRINALL